MIFTKIKQALTAIISIAIVVSVSSCQKDNFTVPSPGANIDPAGVKATMTIKDFKQRYYVPNLSSTLPILITDSVMLEGIVNADDRSGNFYKTISLQDSTGGIQLKIARSNLYYDYPVGRKIFINTKGLYIFNYGGTAEIGGFIDLSGNYPSVGGISGANETYNIIKGQWGLPVPIQKVTISQLIFADQVNMQSILLEIDSVEFSAADTSITYADALTKASVNIALQDCSLSSIVVRSSGYANFATLKANPGHGNIIGLYTYYSFSSTGNTQLTIRDTSDVRFTSSQRCH